jgi:hypothetical protein
MFYALSKLIALLAPPLTRKRAPNSTRFRWRWLHLTTRGGGCLNSTHSSISSIRTVASLLLNHFEWFRKKKCLVRTELVIISTRHHDSWSYDMYHVHVICIHNKRNIIIINNNRPWYVSFHIYICYLCILYIKWNKYRVRIRYVRVRIRYSTGTYRVHHVVYRIILIDLTN